MPTTIPVFKAKQYVRPAELDAEGVVTNRVTIVGSGPIGLAMAIDLADRGHNVLVVTAFDFIASGSKAICFSKQSLDIFDRLGVGARVVEKGVIWNVGKVFWGDRPEPVFEFDMLPVKDPKNPGFVTIQQYYVEDYLCDKAQDHPNIEIRWGHEVTDIECQPGLNILQVETRDGSYAIHAEYVLACDGSKSRIRQAMGLDFQGRIFEDNFSRNGRQSAGSGSTRRLTPAKRRCCTSSPTTFGGWISSSAGISTRPKRCARKTWHRLSKACWVTTLNTRTSGCRSTPFSAGAWSVSGTARCCSPATAPTRSRRSGRAARTPASRTSTTSAGNLRGF